MSIVTETIGNAQTIPLPFIGIGVSMPVMSRCGRAAVCSLLVVSGDGGRGAGRDVGVSVLEGGGVKCKES